jgi:hypothetical protein
VDALEAFATSGTNFNPIELDLDCLSDDCGYTRGVNFHLSDDEYEKVKKYLRDNFDRTFGKLKTNMPLAMQSVQLSTIGL